MPTTKEKRREYVYICAQGAVDNTKGGEEEEKSKKYKVGRGGDSKETSLWFNEYVNRSFFVNSAL